MIPYGCQSIDQSDIDAVVAALRSSFITQGPAIDRFERSVADYCGAKYAVAVSSATAALHILCQAMGAGPGKTVWTSPNTFVASANCARYCDAEVDFVDIDRNSLNLDPEALKRRLDSSAPPNILIPVHFSGMPCAMKAISEICRAAGISIIEDASHAIGAVYGDARTGSCQYSDATVFSFHPVKIVTSGEGGMILTNNVDLYEKARLLRSHGITRSPESFKNEAHGAWYYEQIELGFNYRITDLQAALGCSQMDRLDLFLEKRRRLVERYDQLLKGLPIITPSHSLSARSAWHLYVIRLAGEHPLTRRRAVFDFMRSQNIGVQVHYCPVHLQPYYIQLGFKHGDFPIAEDYYERALSLPLFPDLSDEQQNMVVAALERALS
jgi:UDP-4-amino-4,6-dideoxy-N-acetyl-beta-L-altrosamine transaminase